MKMTAFSLPFVAKLDRFSRMADLTALLGENFDARQRVFVEILQ
jgi:hypothetical protein